MEFPHNNWYLQFTEKERPVVDNWRINIIKFFPSPCPSDTINFKGRGWDTGEDGKRFVKITFDDFKKYILNIEEKIKNQNYNYLEIIFNKLKIK
jgi:hypothetical protein